VGLVNSLTRHFVLGVTSFKKNVHDGKTLASSLDDASRLIGDNEIKEVLVDLGFRGHNYKGNIKITVVSTHGLQLSQRP